MLAAFHRYSGLEGAAARFAGMHEKTGREDARFAGLDEGVGSPVEEARCFTGASRGNAEPLQQSGCLGGEPTARGNARERREREVAPLKRPVPRRVRIAYRGLVPAPRRTSKPRRAVRRRRTRGRG